MYYTEMFGGIILNSKIRLAAAGLLMSVMLTACGRDPELTQFQLDVDAFCSDISEIDTAMNNVAPESENAINEVLSCLDKLDKRFQEFAALDFPAEFDHLENLADEASQYMTEAVSSYRDASTNDAYDEAQASSQYAYAKENYSRAYKRIQIIITLLHGENPKNVDLIIEESGSSDS